MSDDSPTVVREEETGAWGLYHPDEDVIETYIGDDREEINGAYLGENWHEAEPGELSSSIEADIGEARAEIDELRGEDLTDEQEEELDRLESRLEAQENALALNKEVQDDA